MPDPDPSDPGGAHPVNRIASLSEEGRYEMLGAPPSTGGPSEVVVDLGQPQGIRDIVPELTRATRPEYNLPSLGWQPVYHNFYTLVRSEVEAGRDHEDIRAELLVVIENCGELASAAREAVEDALANRTMRCKNPLEP